MKRETQRHQDAFKLWYSSDRNYSAVQKQFSVSQRSVFVWKDAFGWKARADELDREAARKAEREAVAQRARRLREHTQFGELMRRRATEYFVEHKISEAGDAIRAGKEGIAIERQAEGLPLFLVELLSLSDEELERRQQVLLRQLGAAGDPELANRTAEAGDEPDNGWTGEPAGPDDEPAGDDPVLPPGPV